MTHLPNASKYSPIPYGISSAIFILHRAPPTFSLDASTIRVDCAPKASSLVNDGIQLPMTVTRARPRQ
ncbi:hypothetical protein FA13DRAFT_1328164 [Coprinellus micaceus]|uniref:Uncharacterized protein n=1 Tax=Coprinellus micaceus TaxID=71717 RepID=A0A4Y7R4J6_COPMI|nr:hypothetical protein FA13DRAFT_1328164 [Coprinellus micaceus]